MLVTLEPVTLDNWKEVIKIDIADDQRRWVDSPTVLHALAEASFWPSFTSYAIRDRDTGARVGYVAFGPHPEKPIYWFVAILMIDLRYQRRGYGRAAMEAVLAHAKREQPDIRALGLTYRPGNVAAERLYRSLGFTPEGADEDGDIKARYWFTPSP